MLNLEATESHAIEVLSDGSYKLFAIRVKVRSFGDSVPEEWD